MKQVYFLAVVIVLAISLSVLRFDVRPAGATSIIVPNNYPTIQRAIDHANSGDTVSVKAGTYRENVIVNKPIRLLGENPSTTIIDGMQNGVVVQVNANDTTISGFMITGSNHSWIPFEGASGVRLGCSDPSFVSRCQITSNKIVGNDFGISASGFSNTISKNQIYANVREGIFIWSYGAAYDISDNTIKDNGGTGIDLRCSGSVVHGNFLGNNCHGISVSNCYSNDVYQNYILANRDSGIWLSGIPGNSYNNVIYENTIDNRGSVHGNNLRFDVAEGNYVYHNNIVGHTIRLEIVMSDGISWDAGYPSGGNYWSDYPGNDANHDGLGDTQYVIDSNNVDNYPLMNPRPFRSLPIDKTATIVDPMYAQSPNGLFVDTLKYYLAQAGYSSSWIAGSSVTVDWLKTGLNHGVVFWRGHGSYVSPLGVMLTTGEVYTDESRDEYTQTGDFPGRLTHTGGSPDYWVIKPEFISYYYGIDNPFVNSLVYLEACDSYRDDTMAKAFVSSGAGACVGYPQTIQFALADDDAKNAMYDFCMRGYDVQQTVQHKIWYDRRYYGNSLLRLRTEVTGASSLFVHADCPVDLFVVDPEGRRVGMDPVLAQAVYEIPDAIYIGSDVGPEIVWIPNALEGTYDVVVTGTDSGTYDLIIEYETDPLQSTIQNFTGTISKNESKFYSTVLSNSVVSVISWEYVFKDRTRGTMLRIGADGECFQFTAPDKDFGIMAITEMTVKRHIMTMRYNSPAMRLIAIVMVDGIDFCAALVFDKQTGKRYSLVTLPAPATF